MTALSRHFDQLALEHVPTLRTGDSDAFERDATIVSLRCKCGEVLGAYVMDSTRTDTAEGLVQEFIQVWSQFLILHHRNGVLLAEEGWRQGAPGKGPT